MNKYNYGRKPKNQTTLQPVNPKVYNTFLEDVKLKFIKKCILVSVGIILIIFLTFLYIKSKPTSIIRDGHITMSYSDLLKCLDEEPKDITQTTYKSTLPKEVNSDIKKMMASEDLNIIYCDEDSSSYIRISKNNHSNQGYELIAYDEPFSYLSVEFYDNISMYKNGNKIKVYGSSYSSSRELQCIEIKVGTGEINYIDLPTDYFDLYGANIEYDYVRSFMSSMSLIKNGKDFSFFCLGEQIGETVTFPGDEITEFNYYYALDSNNDLYYLFYSAQKEKTWIEFVKVAENIDSVSYGYNENVVISDIPEYTQIRYPIYTKNGKNYVGISNPSTTYFYGQNYNKNEKATDEPEDFNIYTLELSPENVSYLTLKTQDLSLSSDLDWYIQTNYTINGYDVYTEERVNGLDSELSSLLSENEIKRFAEMKISPNELENTINSLKSLYKNYE